MAEPMDAEPHQVGKATVAAAGYQPFLTSTIVHETAVEIVVGPVAVFRIVLRLDAKSNGEYYYINILLIVTGLVVIASKSIHIGPTIEGAEGQLLLADVPITVNFVFIDKCLPLFFDLLGDLFGVAGFPVEIRKVSASARAFCNGP